MTSEELINKLENGEFDILIIGHNCFNFYRRGIQEDLINMYPQIKQADIDGSITPNSRKLGHYSVAKCRSNDGEHQFYVINAYIQYFYGKVSVTCESNGSSLKDRSPVQYEAIYSSFSRIARRFRGKRIAILGFPGVMIDAAKILIEAAFLDSDNDLTYINFEPKEKVIKEN